jgi:hypothetical protein
MNIEQYFSASRVIHEEMTQIATTTCNMEVAHSAHSGNPQFVGLMKRHSELVERFESLHRQFVQSNPNYAA